jgi:hypothetical protein
MLWPQFVNTGSSQVRGRRRVTGRGGDKVGQTSHRVVGDGWRRSAAWFSATVLFCCTGIWQEVNLTRCKTNVSLFLWVCETNPGRIQTACEPFLRFA